MYCGFEVVLYVFEIVSRLPLNQYMLFSFAAHPVRGQNLEKWISKLILDMNACFIRFIHGRKQIHFYTPPKYKKNSLSSKPFFRAACK